MQWSKIKQQLESRFADSLRKRVQIHNAGYRWHHEADGRIWITYDGQEIADFCAHKYQNARHDLKADPEIPRGAVADELRQRGFISRMRARDEMEQYLSLSVDDALASESPLHHGLAVLDRRLGKRRLKRLELSEDSPDFVRGLFELRLEVEDLLKDRVEAG